MAEMKRHPMPTPKPKPDIDRIVAPQRGEDDALEASLRPRRTARNWSCGAVNG